MANIELKLTCPKRSPRTLGSPLEMARQLRPVLGRNTPVVNTLAYDRLTYTVADMLLEMAI